MLPLLELFACGLEFGLFCLEALRLLTKVGGLLVATWQRWFNFKCLIVRLLPPIFGYEALTL